MAFIGMLVLPAVLKAQIPDKVLQPNIRNVKLNFTGNQLAYPIIPVNTIGQLELNFDDLNGGVRNYSYTWQLCNSDWSPVNLTVFDFIKGFTQLRITNYRNSSIAFVKYTHYSASLPDRSCQPSRSGNYLLKVFADGDTARILFTRRVLVVDEKATVAAQVQQPFNGQYFRTHQKLQFGVGFNKLNILNPLQQIKVVLLQNNRWDNALSNIRPTLIRPNSLEYNAEADALFGGGREWRWLDLRSFRLQSDRVETAKYNDFGTNIFVKPDLDRSPQRLVFYRDINGMYYNETSESVNPYWQADFANVHFTFVPPGNQPYSNKEVWMFGELTNYGIDDNAKMSFNAEKGVYETTLLLKQGYYNYSYVTIDKTNARPSFEQTEGNFWETENSYLILVYYRAMGGRVDELIAVKSINSLTGRNGY
jgi:Domain of unknown function (DUF5103)